MDYIFWLLAISGVLLTGISKSGFAGGAGVVAVPLMAMVIPAQQAAALMLPILILMDINNVLLYKRDFHWRYIKPLIIAALSGISMAGFLMHSLPASALQRILAIFCITFALWQHALPYLAKLPGSAYLWGFLSGLSSTLLHAGGPPATIYFMGLKLEKKVWLAQAAVLFTMINIVKIVPYSLSGLWHPSYLSHYIVLIPTALMGVWLGYKIQQVITDKQFLFFCRGLLLSTGIILLLK